MNKVQFLKRIRHPLIPTALGYKILRARLSLRETQAEFAKRFKVTLMTVNHWENGKTSKLQRIHADILNLLLHRLQREGLLVPDEVLTTIYRSEVEKKGNGALV